MGRQSLDAASRLYVTRANALCTASRSGSPGPLAPPYTTASVGSYATAAAPPVRRTVVGLGRLHAPAKLKLIASGLLRVYGKLLPLYAAFGSGGKYARLSPKAGADLIASREYTVTALARAAQLTACGFAAT